MDIQKLQTLAVIQEAGSFSRAAETLGYSQAGLTYMMNSLENEIGLRLLDRSYSGVRLSETGMRVLPVSLATKVKITFATPVTTILKRTSPNEYPAD